MKQSIALLATLMLLAACAAPATPAVTLTPTSIPATAAPEPTLTPTLDPRPQTDTSIRDWRDDLRSLMRAINSMHPNPYWRTPRSDYDRMVSDLDKRIPELTDEQIIVELVRIVALLDGHSNMDVLEAPVHFHLYPIRLYRFSDGMYVVDAAEPTKEAIGGKLISIGGQDAEEVFNQVKPLTQYDNEMDYALMTPMYMMIPEFLHALGIVKDMSQPEFVIETDGKQITLNPAPMTFEEYLQGKPFYLYLVGLPQDDRVLYLQHRYDWNYWYIYLEDSQTLYIQYNLVMASSGNGQSMREFASEIDQFITEHDVAKVVVDVRHNPGGDNGTYPPLLRVLTENEKINQPGKLFVIIGRQTFSAAANFITDVEKQTNALFVGEPSGGAPNLYGDTDVYRLPHSGILVYISRRYWEKSTPDDNRPWIEPDIPAPLSWEDYVNGRDPSMEAILSYQP